MEEKKYALLMDEVFGLIDKDAMENALKGERSRIRMDAVQDLLRSAIMSSSLGMFNGNPYFFNGRIYECITWDNFGNLIYDLMRRSGVKDGDYVRTEMIIRVCRRAVGQKILRPNNSLVVFHNGVLDVSTRILHKFSRSLVQISEMSFDYDRNQYIFLWKQFLDEVLPDKGMQAVLQEFLGSVFLDRQEVKMESMLILLGSGSNGKSVIFETVTGILGRENVSNFGLGSLVAGGERKKNIATINGKRLNYCSEIQAMEFSRENDGLKALISGEPMEARVIYGDNFTAYNIPLIMANANRLPVLSDWSYGMRRRIVVIPFEVEIPQSRQRHTMSHDLEPEYPAIFNWMLEGYDRFVRNGYKLSLNKQLEAVMDAYMSENSSVLSFMYWRNYMARSEFITGMDPLWISVKDLYEEYSQWCYDNREREEPLKFFTSILSEAGYQRRRGAHGVCYAVFGGSHVNVLKKENAERRATERRHILIKPLIDKNGTPWVKTLGALATNLDVTVGTVKHLLDSNRLDGMYYGNGVSQFFNLEKIAELIKSIQNGTAEEKDFGEEEIVRRYTSRDGGKLYLRRKVRR